MRASLLFVGLLLTLFVHAADESGVRPSTLILPTGPGSITGLGESFTPQLNSGTSSQRLPIVVPPGRNGLAPTIALDYNSGYGNGVVGVGRTLSIPFIQRQTDKGLPNYTEPGAGDGQDNDRDGAVDEFDEFDTFVDNQGVELVWTAANIYRAQHGTNFARYKRLPQGWLVVQADGTRWHFGTTPQARIEKAGTGVFAWYLEAVEDTRGNRIDYDYQQLDAGNQIYPHRVRYNTGSLSAQTMLVEFAYENRPDILTDYRSGYSLKTTHRLSAITTKRGSQVLRVYQLSYHPTDDWRSQSLLAQVHVSAGSVQLPSTHYQYTAYTPAELQVATMPTAVQTSMGTVDADFFDMNGDGLPDIIDTGPSRDSYWVNLGPDTDGVPQWQSLQRMSTHTSAGLSSDFVTWADIDGDGTANQLEILNNRITHHSLDGNYNWHYGGQIKGVQLHGGFSSNVVKMVDINHDKRIDMVQTSVASSGQTSAHTAQLNLPNGWSNLIDLPMPANSASVHFNNPNTKLADMNGDGLADLAYVTNGYLSYFPHRGLNGFGPEVVFSGVPRTLHKLDNIHLADLNNDGRSDLVYLDGAFATIWLNKGLDTHNHSRALLATSVQVNGPPRLLVAQSRFVDINGNGSTDIVWSGRLSGQNTLAFAEFFPSEQPHQLKTITNGMGKKTTLFYGSVAQELVRDRQAGQAWTQTVPVAMQILKKVVVDDGMGQQHITHIDYHNGYYNGYEKEFRGFAASEEIRVGDLSAPTLITAFQFHVGAQQEVLKGKPIRIETRNSAGQVFWQEQQQWEARTFALGHGGEPRTASFAAQLRRDKTWIEQGRGSPVTLSWHYDYDNSGNTTRIEELGRDDIGWLDERTTVMRFSAESASGQQQGILDRPIERTVSDAVGNIVAKEQWFYDDETFAGNNLGEVSRGELTLHKVWFDPSLPGAFVNAERYRYDPYGNRVDRFDPLWSGQPGSPHHTHLTFDEDHHTYPVQEAINTGTLTLTAAAQYNLGLGVLNQYTDFNGQVTHYHYDGLGRLTAVAKPGDTQTAPTTTYRYQLGQSVAGDILNWVETSQRESLGGGTIDSRTYYDGLGRAWMTRAEGEVVGQVVVDEHLQFNARGGVYRRYRPYFSQSLAYSKNEVGKHYVEQHYDALERVVLTQQPFTVQDGKAVFSRITYSPLSQLIEDEEQTALNSAHVGAAKRLTFDGLLNKDGVGRLRRVDEIVGLTDLGENSPTISEWSTHYDYDLLDNFTRFQDSQGNVRTMMYDALGREYFNSDPNRGNRWQAYDAAGNLLATRDGKGQERHYDYDGANRPLNEYHRHVIAGSKPGEVWQPVPDTTALPVVSYHYDRVSGLTDPLLKGRVVRIDDQAGSVHYRYDTRGRVQEQRHKIQGHGIDSAVYTTQHAYDSADRLTQYQYADGTTLNYHYNPRGLLDSIPGVISGMNYTPAAKPSSRQLVNGVTTTWHYDERERLQGLSSTRSTDNLSLQQLSYHFDAVSNLTSIVDARSLQTLQTLASELQMPATQAVALSQSFNYQYDDVYRLTTAASEQTQYGYRYDRIGNLVHSTEGPAAQTSLTSTSYRYGGTRYGGTGTNNKIGTGKEKFGAGRPINNLATWGRQGWQADKVAGPQALVAPGVDYDENGNRTQQEGQHYTWDHHNRLTSVSSSTGTSHYGYDFEHQRRYKVVEKAGVRVETLYLDSRSELRGGVLHKYVIVDGQRIAFSTQNSGPFVAEEFYLHQHLGSTALTLNAQATVQNAFTYKAYGDLEQQFGVAAPTPYGFTGKEQDEESGLGYFHHRYLDMHSGRFLTPDPIFALPERFTDPQQWAAYAYGRNNPIKYVDPDGKNAITAFANGAVTATSSRMFNDESTGSGEPGGSEEPIRNTCPAVDGCTFFAGSDVISERPVEYAFEPFIDVDVRAYYPVTDNNLSLDTVPDPTRRPSVALRKFSPVPGLTLKSQRMDFEWFTRIVRFERFREGHCSCTNSRGGIDKFPATEYFLDRTESTQGWRDYNGFW